MKLDSCLSPVTKHVEQMDKKINIGPKILWLLEKKTKRECWNEQIILLGQVPK